MKRFAFAALLIGVAGLAAPASAQYYGGGGGGGYGPGYDYDRPPPPGYGRGGGGGYGRGYEPEYDRRGYGPPPPRRGGGGSSLCVTSRGNCPIGAVVPRNTPCGCEIPGFGYKRGAAAG